MDDKDIDNDFKADIENGLSPNSASDRDGTGAVAEVLEKDTLFNTSKIIYHISEFDGPLDLLYTLIKEAKIDIEDIFISDITYQYVEIVNNTPAEEMDFEYASEFVAMAAELIYLKSLRTLPHDEPIDEDDPEYERQLLVNKIKEFALLKEQSEKMRPLETINRFYRTPVYTDKDYRVALVNFSLPKLVAAFAQVLANADYREKEVIPKKVMKERFSVHDKMQSILDVMIDRSELEFTELFEEDYDRTDIVTTFLAVLELLKYGRLHAEQEELFGTIKLFRVDGADAPIEFEEGDDGEY